MLYRWIIYVESLFWGDRMRGCGRFRLVIVYVNTYAVLLYYDRHQIKLQNKTKQYVNQLTKLLHFTVLPNTENFCKI